MLEQIKRAHFMTGRPFTELDYNPSLPVNYAEETYGLGLGLGSYRGKTLYSVQKLSRIGMISSAKNILPTLPIMKCIVIVL